jgi:protein-tyrosine phosphatase
MNETMKLSPDDRTPGLTGAHNFRDIGGYAAAGGQVVRGKVFRSGTLAALTDDDHAVMDALGIKVICDFRSTRERRDKPSRFAPAATFEILARDHETSAADLIRAMAAPGATPETSRQKMIDAYRILPYEQAESYTGFFNRIVAGDMPIVFHCSAGKDRTGIAAALLLDVLGVARETVIEDYMVTDRFIDGLVTIIKNDPGSRRLEAIPEYIWAPLVTADRAYIETMFETVEARHGNAEGFMREVLGMDDAAMAALRRQLVVAD